MENIFDAVWQTLDNNHINFDDLSGAINDIHQSYSIRFINSEQASSIDYDQDVYQYAYIYLYLTSHTYIVADLLAIFWKHRIVKKCFENCKQSFRVCSIGGGPGSDIFGINLFLEKYVGRINFHGNVLDNYISWENVFNDLLNKLNARNLNNVCYRSFDFFEEDEDDVEISAIASADIVTVIKFVSAVGADRNYAENKLVNLLQELKTGALVLFLDNNGGGYLELMHRAATRARLKNIDELTDHDFEIPMEERLGMERCNQNHSLTLPQQQSRVCASIWFKGKYYQTRRNRNNPRPNVRRSNTNRYQSLVQDDFEENDVEENDVEDDDSEEDNGCSCVIL